MTTPAKIEQWTVGLTCEILDEIGIPADKQWQYIPAIARLIAAHAPQEPSVPVSNLRGIIGALEFEIHQAEQPKRGKDD